MTLLHVEIVGGIKVSADMTVFLLIAIPILTGLFLSLIIKLEEGIKDESYL